MPTFLAQPYPFYYEPLRLPKLSATIAAITAAFLFFLKPIGIENGIAHQLVVICTVYGALAGIMFYIYFRTLPIIFVDFFNSDNWTILKEILSFVGLFLLVGLVNFMVRPLLFESDSIGQSGKLLIDVTNTFLVGILVLGILTLVNFRYLFQNQEEKAELLGFFLKSKQSAQKPATDELRENSILQIQSKNESFELDPKQIRFIKADGNYVIVHDGNNERTSEQLKRIPLKELEHQLLPVTHLFRTHRAYIVNLNHIVDIKGNAQGYQLKLSGTHELIPVSRSYLKAFDEAFSSR